MADAALALARAVGYASAGTVEFVYDADAERFYFLEMNTRIQVEHPVTEMITGVDLVREQLRIAAGERLSHRQKDLQIKGHAVECRINAEDPGNGFRPSPGTLQRWLPPQGKGIRVDTHCYEGYTIPVHYDSLLAKVIAIGPDRGRATALMSDALGRLAVEGVHTTVPLHRAVLADPVFGAGRATTRWLENDFLPRWHAATPSSGHSR
jgi:acetyl-CoA carboxylase biotin carboxylase subunit